MKFLETFEKYKIIDKMKRNDTFLYYFKSPKNTYEVKITPYQGTKRRFFSIGFGITKQLGYDTEIIVNENPYEVMDTVFSIMKSFVDDLNNDEFIKNYNLNAVEGFIFSFTGDKHKNEQRLKLYTRSMKKYIPNANLEYKNGIYYVEL
jgi:hypothetical protein